MAKLYSRHCNCVQCVQMSSDSLKSVYTLMVSPNQHLRYRPEPPQQAERHVMSQEAENVSNLQKQFHSILKKKKKKISDSCGRYADVVQRRRSVRPGG